MMNVKELRIGNWIQSAAAVKRWIKVEILDDYPNNKNAINGLENGDNDWYEPIPLTPEIVEKCRFTKSTNGPYFENYRLPNGYGIAHCIEDTNTDSEGRPYHTKDSFYCGTTDREIKYLHRLQNLVYEICDYEINYTP